MEEGGKGAAAGAGKAEGPLEAASEAASEAEGTSLAGASEAAGIWLEEASEAAGEGGGLWCAGQLRLRIGVAEGDVIAGLTGAHQQRYLFFGAAVARAERHQRRARPGEAVAGLMPVVDDEYPQLEACLRAAQDAARRGRSLTVVELGAWSAHVY